MVAPPYLQLGSIGMADSLILMVLALVVFGPRRLPQIGRQIGKLMYEFRKASNDFKFQMEEELRVSEEADRRKKEEAARLASMALAAPVQTVEAQADIGAIEPTASLQQLTAAAEQLSVDESESQEPSLTEAAAEEPVIRLPRIQPPATGAPVAGTRPGSQPFAEVNPVPEANSAAEVTLSAEPTPPPVETPSATAGPSSDPARDQARTEPVSQHG
jgi:sec-independent protein translocase protein TatB